MTKHATQVAVLVTVAAVFLGVLIFMFRDALLPKAIGGGLFSSRAHIEIPQSEDYQALFDRPDYKALQRHADVPVRPLGAGGNRDLFEPPAPVATR